MAVAAGDQARVGLHEVDQRGRDAEPGGGDLREHRLVPLAVGVGAEPDRDAAIRGEVDRGALVERAAGGFQEAAHAEAAQAAVAGRRLARRAGKPAASASAAPGRCCGRSGRCRWWWRRRWRAGTVSTRLRRRSSTRSIPVRRGGLVHQALDQVVGLRLAGAAVGVERDGVGERAARDHGHGRDVVAAAHGVARRGGGRAGAAGGQAGAEVGDGVDQQRQEPAVAVQPQPGAGEVVAAVGGGDEVLAVVGGPAHRPAERAGGPEAPAPAPDRAGS